MREREFARLDMSTTPAPVAPATFPKGAAVKKLAGGFEALGGGVLDSHGTLYFVDRIFQRIYAWTQEQGLRIVSSHPLDPVNLAVDRSDNLLVLSSAGFEAAVYSLKPDGLDGAITRIEAQPAGTHPDAAIALPVIWWVNGEFKDQYDPARDQFPTLAELFARDVAEAPSREYVSPDGSLVLPAFRVFHQGPPDYRGWRFSHSLDTYGFAIAKPGTRLYVSSGGGGKTYAATVGPNGALEDLKVSSERGGESVTADASGRVYWPTVRSLCTAPTAKPLGNHRRAGAAAAAAGWRPEQCQTLFILTHHSLYSVNVGQAGN